MRFSRFRPTCSAAVLCIVASQRKLRQPAFAPHGPVFIGGRELIGGIQGSQMHFDLVTVPGENR